MQEYINKLNEVKNIINNTNTIVIGAGAGLSSSAGLEYTGKRLNDNFADFIEKYHFKSMYEAAFYNFETLEEKWAYFSRHILLNRYTILQNELYQNLFKLVCDKNYFVITTNVDHMFLSNGFEKEKIFYTQGDYGLWQCSVPCHNETYNNEMQVKEMVKTQLNMRIPHNLVPYCPKCGAPMANNLRADNTFVEPQGWHNAAKRYEDFLINNKQNNIVFLELGVGFNTPGIIKYPFWQMTNTYKNAKFITFNLDEIYIPKEITQKSIGIKGDIKNIIFNLKNDLF